MSQEENLYIDVVQGFQRIQYIIKKSLRLSEPEIRALARKEAEDNKKFIPKFVLGKITTVYLADDTYEVTVYSNTNQTRKSSSMVLDLCITIEPNMGLDTNTDVLVYIPPEYQTDQLDDSSTGNEMYPVIITSAVPSDASNYEFIPHGHFSDNDGGVLPPADGS